MKKLFGTVIIAFCLGIFLTACGGSSIKTTSTTQNSAQSGVTNTVQTSATAENSGKKIDVVGKTCPPAGTYKVTSTDIVEAVINTYCQDMTTFPNSTSYPKGTVEFVSLKIRSGADNSDTTHIVVRFVGCADCPHDYSGYLGFSKNPLGEWQLSNSGGNYVKLSETDASKTAVAERNKQQSIAAAASVTIDIPVRDLETDFYDNLKVNLVITGKVDEIHLLCQMDDGKTIEYWYIGLVVGPTLEFRPMNSPSGGPFHLIVLAYKFHIEPGYNSPDWIYFNK